MFEFMFDGFSAFHAAGFILGGFLMLAFMPVTILTGLGLMAGAYFLYKDMNDLLRRALPAQGQVIQIVGRPDSDGVMYYPDWLPALGLGLAGLWLTLWSFKVLTGIVYRARRI